MATEDATPDLEAIDRLIDSRTRRASSCGVCEWIESRPPAEQELWDRRCAQSVKDAGHQAIWLTMAELGLTLTTSKPIETHRSRRHRVT